MNDIDRTNTLKECIGGILYEFEELDLWDKENYDLYQSEYYQILCNINLQDNEQVQILERRIIELKEVYTNINEELEY